LGRENVFFSVALTAPLDDIRWRQRQGKDAPA
jgi:hypothetical protein